MGSQQAGNPGLTLLPDGSAPGPLCSLAPLREFGRLWEVKWGLATPPVFAGVFSSIGETLG